MIRKYLLIIFLSLLITGFCSNGTLAQIIDVGEEIVEEPEEPAEEGPEEVMKLEELIIEVEALKVFSIPRMDAELPPIDFTGLFKNEYIEPSLSFFKPKNVDIKHYKVAIRKKILDKERK